jgi:hypothetical protein
MRDRRLRHMRPSHLECLKAALARRMPGRTRVPVGVESPILPIVWKGGPDVLAGLGLSPDCQTFDWRACGRYWELNKEIAEHQSRHGSVSPSWGEEAAAELQICSKVMSSTAMAIAGVLQDRRKAYRQLARRGRSSNAQSVVS